MGNRSRKLIVREGAKQIVQRDSEDEFVLYLKFHWEESHVPIVLELGVSSGHTGICEVFLLV
jgi:hypothetical protein